MCAATVAGTSRSTACPRSTQARTVDEETSRVGAETSQMRVGSAVGVGSVPRGACIRPARVGRRCGMRSAAFPGRDTTTK